MVLLLDLLAKVLPVEVEDRGDWKQVNADEAQDIYDVDEEVVFADPHDLRKAFDMYHHVDGKSAGNCHNVAQSEHDKCAF